MKIILASGNRHKQREIQAMLSPAQVLLPTDLNIDFEHEETGDSFLENSLGKAHHLYELVHRPVLADDSGLVVPALGGEPGITSARYGADLPIPPADDRERYELLLKRMDQIDKREAMFVCCLVLVESEYHFSVVQETWEGVIARESSGANGFGYDPVFYVPREGATSAELSPNRKDAISHRGKALARMKRLLSE